MKHLFVLLVLFAWAADAPAARNWSFWRGPEETGVSRERDLPEKWSLSPKVKDNNLVFAANYGAIATPIVQDGQVYLIGKTGERETLQEAVRAFDADTGALKWEHKFNVWHTDIVEDRLGWTHMVGDPETGNVYAHLTSGLFLCFSRGGKILWQHSLTEEYARLTGYGGRVTSPIVDEDKVIVSMINGPWGELTVGNTRMVAFDKKTGAVIWWGSGGYRVKDTYYSTPVVAVINGLRLILTGGGDGCIHAFKVRTGEKVWSYVFEDGGGAINCSPVVKGNKVWVGHGEENVGNGTQGRLICLDASEVKDGHPKLVWQYDGIKVKFASPILHNGLLYVCDDAGKMYCFDAETGKKDATSKETAPLWDFEYGKNTKGSPVWADGKFYVSEVDSKFHILKDNGREEPTRLHQYRFRGKGVVPVELHGSPAIVNGRVYFTTTEQLICIGKKDHNAQPDAISEAPHEPGAGSAAAPTHLQVVPADVLLKPGESVDFRAYAYDASGQRLGEVSVEWEKAGMLPPVYPIGLKAPPAAKGPKPPPIAGDLSEASGNGTKLTVSKLPNGQFGRVVAKSGKLTAFARVRVASVLPYANDFSKVPEGRTPAGWVNTMGKYSVVTLKDGQKVLRKRNDNAAPPVARIRAYIGSPHQKDYTIETEIYGTKLADRGKDMPDVGIGACRYLLTLLGNDQELRLGSWDAQKRIGKKIAFPWKPKTWYRMKLTATVVNGKGVVKGKVWPKGESEPEKWTLEIEDPVPNREGAPVVYGFPNGVLNVASPGPEIYYSYVRITPNLK
jgi:outer membrane protein assembly factor BamB